MPLEEIMQAENLRVGVKQSSRLIIEGKASKLFIAKDAEQHVTRRIISLATENDVEIEEINSMTELGKACGIDVGAATAVLIKIKT